jgi:ribulose kinase
MTSMPVPQGTGTSTTDSEAYAIGVDSGTLSGRAVVVRVSDGAELGSASGASPARTVPAEAVDSDALERDSLDSASRDGVAP